MQSLKDNLINLNKKVKSEVIPVINSFLEKYGEFKEFSLLYERVQQIQSSLKLLSENEDFDFTKDGFEKLTGKYCDYMNLLKEVLSKDYSSLTDSQIIKELLQFDFQDVEELSDLLKKESSEFDKAKDELLSEIEEYKNREEEYQNELNKLKKKNENYLRFKVKYEELQNKIDQIKPPEEIKLENEKYKIKIKILEKNVHELKESNKVIADLRLRIEELQKSSDKEDELLEDIRILKTNIGWYERQLKQLKNKTIGKEQDSNTEDKKNHNKGRKPFINKKESTIEKILMENLNWFNGQGLNTTEIVNKLLSKEFEEVIGLQASSMYCYVSKVIQKILISRNDLSKHKQGKTYYYCLKNTAKVKEEKTVHAPLKKNDTIKPNSFNEITFPLIMHKLFSESGEVKLKEIVALAKRLNQVLVVSQDSIQSMVSNLVSKMCAMNILTKEMNNKREGATLKINEISEEKITGFKQEINKLPEYIKQLLGIHEYE